MEFRITVNVTNLHFYFILCIVPYYLNVCMINVKKYEQRKLSWCVHVRAALRIPFYYNPIWYCAMLYCRYVGMFLPHVGIDTRIIIVIHVRLTSIAGSTGIHEIIKIFVDILLQEKVRTSTSSIVVPYHFLFVYEFL